MDDSLPLDDSRETDNVIAAGLEAADVGVFVLDPTFSVVWLNEAAERYFGIERTAVVGREKRTIIDELLLDRVADGETFRETVFATYEDNTYLENFECRITPGDGREERWLEHVSSPIESGPYAGGRIEWYYDITERKESERARLTGEQQFRSLVQAVDEYAIFTLDPDGRVATWNRGAERIKGYERGEILGEHVSVFYTDDDVDAGVPEQNLAAAAREGSVTDAGLRRRKDGEAFWANVAITAIHDDEGELQGFAKVTRDMTDRHEQEALRHRKRLLGRYKQYTDDVLNAIDDILYVLDEHGDFRRWNDAVHEVTGYTDEEIDSMHALEFFESDEQETIANAIATCFETGSVQVEARLLTKDGEYIPYEFIASTLEDPEGTTVVAGIGRDVTERNAHEAELERRANQQRAVADLGQFALEVDDIDELMEEAVRQVADVLETKYAKVLDLDAENRELLVRHGVGWRPGIVGSATVGADDNSQAGYTLLSEEPVVVDDLATETRFSGPALLTSHDVKSGISTIIGSVDDPWGVLGTHDIDHRTFTEQDVDFVQSVANVLAEAIERHNHQAELETLVDDLAASNERLEQFAYAASHDLQEPLRMVSSYLQLIDTRYGDALDDDAREFLDYAVDGADRMRDMIDGLLAYSRVENQGEAFEPVELDAVLDAVCDDLQVKRERHDADITVESLPRVVGDAGQLRQVFLNLLDNAIEYNGEGPTNVIVSASRENDQWVVSVRDNGVGIDPDDTDRIFEVFERLHTQDEHAGTGIGLALCERIVERHGGEIRVDSVPGEGTTFSVTLPAATGEDA